MNDFRGLSPIGYHIPSDAEWTVLTNHLGGEYVAGKKIKSTNGWDGYGCKRCDGGSATFRANCIACKGTQENSTDSFNGNGTNTSGFSCLPSGVNWGYFNGIGKLSRWWCANENVEVSACWIISGGTDYFGPGRRNLHKKSDGLSVRCIKD